MKNQNMKNKYLQLRNPKGHFDGIRKPWTAGEVIRIIIGLSFGTGLAIGIIKVGDMTLAAKPVQAMSQTECEKVGTNYDCTTSGTKALLFDLASHGNVVWHDASELELLKRISDYQKKYTKARADVVRTIVLTAQAEKYGDVDYLFRLIDCESKFDPSEVNTHGNYPTGSKDRGLMQFNSYWQKKVTDICAFDMECSLKTAIIMLKNGQNGLWACNDIINH